MKLPLLSSPNSPHINLKAQKVEKNHCFLKPEFEDLAFGREIPWEVPVARGPAPPSPPGHKVGFTADWHPLRCSSKHCCSLTLSGEKPAGGRVWVCGEQPSPPVILATPSSLDHACNWASSVPSLAWHYCSGHQSPRSLSAFPSSWGTRKGSSG